MGKHGKKQKQNHRRTNRQSSSHFSQEEDFWNDSLEYPPSSSASSEEKDVEVEEEMEEEQQNEENPLSDRNSIIPSKFLLYQQSVQSPKGDISYLRKFFLMYVGGRIPLHLQEDFCGTAFLSTEWLRGDPQRTAVGLDLDLDALVSCSRNNVDDFDSDQNNSIISLVHWNVLQPLEARVVDVKPDDLIREVKLGGREEEEDSKQDSSDARLEPAMGSAASTVGKTLKDYPLPARDIVCACNYSCCCLHKRKELVSYFRHARGALSSKGGIFVMDLYGRSSSKHELKLKRRFPNFMVVIA